MGQGAEGFLLHPDGFRHRGFRLMRSATSTSPHPPLLAELSGTPPGSAHRGPSSPRKPRKRVGVYSSRFKGHLTVVFGARGGTPGFSHSWWWHQGGPSSHHCCPEETGSLDHLSPWAVEGAGRGWVRGQWRVQGGGGCREGSVRGQLPTQAQATPGTQNDPRSEATQF